jgi:uncharacterized phage protein gp47/JayE
MYESITYDVILQRMLDAVITADPNVDTREASIIYNALAPAAVELQNMYIEFDWIMNQAFADTSTREYLIRRAAERGIIPEPATNAILQGNFNMDVPIGSRFSLNDLNYEATEKISLGVFKMQCETTGEIGNSQLGSIIPIEYINGLTTAELTAVLIPGEDEEDTEILRTRYLTSFQNNPYGGNKQDYIDKTNVIAGVGSTKVTPIWNGGGTVKLTILDSNFDKATPTLISTVQEVIDPSASPGDGLGIAPIGHIVTVDTSTEVITNISAVITLDTGYDWSMVSADVIATMQGYLLELRAVWATASVNYVRIAQIETRILAIEGIIDISGTTINSVAANLTLGEFEIPILGVVTKL